MILQVIFQENSLKIILGWVLHLGLTSFFTGVAFKMADCKIASLRFEEVFSNNSGS